MEEIKNKRKHITFTALAVVTCSSESCSRTFGLPISYVLMALSLVVAICSAASRLVPLQLC